MATFEDVYEEVDFTTEDTELANLLSDLDSGVVFE